jgi:hypothetical protein
LCRQVQLLTGQIFKIEHNKHDEKVNRWSSK